MTLPNIYKNQCYRKGPCLNGEWRETTAEEAYDYREGGRYYKIESCRLHQLYYTQSPLEAELEENYRSGLTTQQHSTPDAQLHDSNGIWFTNTSDPENYHQITPLQALDDEISDPEDDYDLETKICRNCSIICEIRDWDKYLNEDGTCPYPDATEPQPIYRRVEKDRECGDYLHPLLLQDLERLNQKRRRIAKSKLWGYLKQKKWRDTLIQKGEPISAVWRRNYRPAVVYYRSFETVFLYLKNLPPEMKSNKFLLQRVRKNIEYSPSFKQCLGRGEWEERMLGNIDRIIKI